MSENCSNMAKSTQRRRFSSQLKIPHVANMNIVFIILFNLLAAATLSNGKSNQVDGIQNGGGAPPTTFENVFCPFNGRYKFTYKSNGSEFSCDTMKSEISNCRNGNILDVKFRGCNFPDMDMQFQCLGDWESPTGERYIALMDLRQELNSRPKFRCGILKEEPTTGRIYVSLAMNSTCQTQLTSTAHDFETLTLTPMPQKRAPSIVESSKCRFPEWAQGKWENSLIDGNRFVFRDGANNYRTVTARCVHRQNNTPNDRFIVYTQTNCGTESYDCLWLKRRSPNIIEFQFTEKGSPHLHDRICDDSNFMNSVWITQGRRQVLQPTSCPITGDYTGVVPGTQGLCAKVASDCNNPDIMFYSVTSCENRSHVYEEREYRCLGNWEEDGILYTYTQRKDLPNGGFECFSGKIYANGQEAYIKEAGESCVRGEDPLVFGMKIVKQASCPRLPIVASNFMPKRPSDWAALMPSPSLPPPAPASLRPHQLPQMHQLSTERRFGGYSPSTTVHPNSRHTNTPSYHQQQQPHHHSYPSIRPLAAIKPEQKDPPPAHVIPLMKSPPSKPTDPHYYQADSITPTTKPWRPITAIVGRPRVIHDEASSSSAASSRLSLIFIVFSLIIATTCQICRFTTT